MEGPGGLRCLTDREREVLEWVAEGKTNAEIGLIVEARPRTVAKHLERIFQKLGVESRTAAARVVFDALGGGRRWRSIGVSARATTVRTRSV